jgi:hypothetical protein
MAKKLKTFDFQREQGSKYSYPWDKWLDGNIWELSQGEDFRESISPSNFRIMAYQAAKKRGLKIRTSVQKEKVIIQAYKPTK